MEKLCVVLAERGLMC